VLEHLCNELRIQRLENFQLRCRRKALSWTPAFLNHKPQVNQHLPLIIQSREIQKMSQAFSYNNNSFNVANKVTFNYTTPDDESKILAWLSPLEPWAHHRDIGAERVDGIGAWLLEAEEFKRWHHAPREGEANHAILFCDGNPGVGKSYIM